MPLGPHHPAAARRAYWTGIAYALAAFGAWGVVNPVYMKALGGVPALEIMAHRIVWSALLAAVLVAFSHRWAAIDNAFRPRNLMLLAMSAMLITLNWTIFLVSILDGHLVEASFGYFINPLVSVALGVAVLGERLRPVQVAACGIAVLGIAVPIVARGAVPWIALTLAVTFGLYGLVRKVVRVESLVGFAVEVGLLAPVAAGYLIYLALSGGSAFTGATPGRDGLLLGTGAITAGPLIWFAVAARRLPLSTVGILQFIAPTGGLLLGVFAFGESFTMVEGVAFGCIWTALALYVADALRMPRAAAVSG